MYSVSELCTQALALAYTYLTYFFSVRSRRTSKSEKFQKALISGLRINVQISLVLSHACRYRKRLISLVSSQTYFEIIPLACCEYSQNIFLLTFVSKSVNLSDRVSVSDYPKGCQCIRAQVAEFAAHEEII